jgi:hypothetical protein
MPLQAEAVYLLNSPSMTDHELIRRIIREELKPTNDKVNEMWSIFTNAKGFGDIAVTLLKALVLFGAAAGVIIAFIKYLKS